MRIKVKEIRTIRRKENSTPQHSSMKLPKLKKKKKIDSYFPLTLLYREIENI